MKRFHSIISRLVALHVVAIGVISILMPLALYWLLNEAANGLHRDALRSQAATIAGFLRPQPGGGVALDIPAEMQSLYASSYGLYAYAVLNSTGRVLFSSRNDGQALSPDSDPLTNPSFSRRRTTGTVFSGVNVARAIGDHVYWIQVGQDLAHRDVIIDDIVTSFFPRVAWITFPILLALLVIDILIFRRALNPLHEVSTIAAAIGPTKTDVRLPEQSLPTEVVPLVRAVNQALDRLDAGFRAQRDFTADMAHELRTPLTIIRARVDSLDTVTRVVNQVLDIAELESFVVAPTARADLQAVCADAVSFMAPLAISSAKTIALTGVETPVWVHGDSETLFRAVRTLVDNAIRHTPTDGAVEVDVSADGMVRVFDNGPGVPETERELIFRRFWRRDQTKTDSRGIGLAIVARVAAVNDGTVTVARRSEGGAVFTLRLRLA